MAPRAKQNGKIDEEIEETFPASDPPSFMGGEVLGAPKGRRTPARRAAKPVRKAKKGAHKSKAKPSAKKAAAKQMRHATKKRRATKKRTSR